MVVKFFHFFRVVCVVKGFEDGFSDNSDLSFFPNRPKVDFVIRVYVCHHFEV
jgi:hypothetical protein